MAMFQKICVSMLFAFVIEALCVLLLMSGGVFFGPLAYIGIYLLWPPLYVGNLVFGDGGFLFGFFLAFIQFFALSLWLVARLSKNDMTMKRIGKYLLIAFGVVVLLIAIGYVYLLQPANDGRTPAERRQIADACFAMMHSSLTNEDIIKPDDPRIPEVVRALHPVGILVDADFSVEIDFNTKPGEYFLMRLPSHTNTWILCAAGAGIPFGPREVLRIEHD